MKLRNKKTGEVIDPAIYVFKSRDDGIRYGHNRYDSIAELNEDWEDYKPAEPLIKDEKVRNLVREWIKLWETGDRWYVCDNKSGEISIARSDIELILPLSYGIEDGYYTVAELCGEEGE